MKNWTLTAVLVLLLSPLFAQELILINQKDGQRLKPERYTEVTVKDVFGRTYSGALDWNDPYIRVGSDSLFVFQMATISLPRNLSEKEQKHIKQLKRIGYGSSIVLLSSGIFSLNAISNTENEGSGIGLLLLGTSFLGAGILTLGITSGLDIHNRRKFKKGHEFNVEDWDFVLSDTSKHTAEIVDKKSKKEFYAKETAWHLGTSASMSAQQTSFGIMGMFGQNTGTKWRFEMPIHIWTGQLNLERYHRHLSALVNPTFNRSFYLGNDMKAFLGLGIAMGGGYASFETQRLNSPFFISSLNLHTAIEYSNGFKLGVNYYSPGFLGEYGYFGAYAAWRIKN